MATLAQLIAAREGEKTRAQDTLTEAYQRMQKTDPMKGLARQYTPIEDGGEQLPPESTRVQIRAQELIDTVVGEMTKLFDLTAQIEYGNCEAKADVVVDGEILLTGVPVSYLLFLEKQLVNFRTFITKLPLLDPADEWRYDENQACYATPAVQTTRTKKVPRNHVKSEATKEHPAQVEVFYEDIRVGTWSTIKFSGALPAERVRELAQRVDVLQKAVKFAREQANSGTAPKVAVGEKFFSYLFGE